MYKSFGMPLELPVKLVEQAGETSSCSKQELARYKTSSSKVRLSDEQTYPLFQLLEGVTDSWAAPTGSDLDTHLKVDVVYTVGGKAYGVQLKSSEAGAMKHLSLEQVVYGGRAYHLPGVIWLDNTPSQGQAGVALLLTLAKLTGLAIKPEVKRAFAVYQALVKTGADPRRGLTAEQRRLLAPLALPGV